MKNSNLNATGMWEIVADPDSDDLFLPVVSDMQYSGLSSTPIIVILKQKDLVTFHFRISASVILSFVHRNKDERMIR